MSGDEKLEQLIRMAIEADEVARGGADRSFLSNPARRRAIVRRLVSPALAAAASLLLVLQLSPTGPDSRLRPSIASAVALSASLDYCPAVATHTGTRVDRFEPVVGEPCVVLAIFHSWQDECQCLEWQLYEWEDGGALAEMTPDQLREITLDVTDAPPVQQLLVVAIARQASDLPRNDEQTTRLVHCLNEVQPPTAPGENTDEYASAVRACLPNSEDVTIVPQAFYVE